MEAKSVLCRLPGACGIEDIVETAEVNKPVGNPYLRDIVTVLGMYMNTRNSGFVTSVPTGVFPIFSIGNLSKVVDSVVASIAINMVNLIFWPSTIVVKPCKSVGLIDFPRNGYPSIPAAINKSHDIANFPAAKLSAKLVPTTAHRPSENSSCAVVMDVLLQLLLIKHEGTFSQKVVGGLRQPLTGWLSGCIPSRKCSLPIKLGSRQSLYRK